MAHAMQSDAVAPSTQARIEMKKNRRQSSLKLRPVAQVRELNQTDLLGVSGGGKKKKKKMETVFIPAFAARP